MPEIAPKATPHENFRIKFREIMQTQVKFNLVFPKIFKLSFDIWCCEKSLIKFARLFKTIAQKFTNTM